MHGRRLWVQIHIWIALSLGWLIALVGMSGSVLIYKAELDQLFHPSGQPPSRSGPPVEISRIMAVAYSLFSKDSGSWSLTFPQETGEPYRVTYFNNDLTLDAAEPVDIWIDPYQPRLLRLEQAGGRWLEDWLYRFHSTLLLGGQGKGWIAVLGGVFGISVISGLYLWWPWRKAKFRGKLLDFHHWGGMLSAPVLLFSIATGLYLAIPPQWVPWLHEEKTTVQQDSSQSPYAGKRLPLSVETIIDRTLAVFPGSQPRRLSFPENLDDFYLLELYWPGYADTPKGWVKVAVDAYLGRVISYQLPPHQGVRSWLEQWIYLLHNGSAMGSLGRVVLCLGGLFPSLLMVTGTLTWWRRYQRRKKRRYELLPG
ncbi:MAG: hypothetical protein AXA67_01255 [Methylothermaceae bacteria B42]|nr:MAG: hypothetical protein AXA67_01255 [Methylothermaceae bacteria B42]